MIDKVVDILQGHTDELATAMLTIALSLAGVGTVSMAILEGIKALAPVRVWFNRWRARDWIGENPGCWAEFMALTTGGYASQRALFDQPVEKFMAQVQAGANLAMDFPDRYPNFYGLLTRQDVKYSADDSSQWKEHIEKMKERQPESEITLKDRDAAKARARLQNAMARQLDAFQTETQFWWARSNQFASTAIGIAIIMSALWASFDLIQILPIALMGGMTAPFAKDVVSNLSSFRK